MTSIPWLTLLWVVPAAGAIVIAALPTGARGAARHAGVAVSVVALGVALAVAMRFDPGGEQFQFVESHIWIPSFGTGYLLGVDGIALALVLLTTVLMPLLLLAGWRDTKARGYVALMLATEAMVLLSLVALDILLFYVLFEAMLIPMYFLIGVFGGGAQRGRAALKFLLYNLFGGLLMLAAVIGLYVLTARSSAFDGGTFDFRAISAAIADGSFVIAPPMAVALFGGFMVAFAIKAPMWPLHRWLPGAAVQATPAVAVLMMAVVDKVGTFGMLRYCLPLFADAAVLLRPVIITLAVIGIVYGAILAIAQTDVMRLIAYTSISHFSFIILGIFAMTSQGQTGATFYMVNHGISTAALFLVAGFLVSRRGSRLIADYGGVAQVAPVLAGTFLVAGLATLALPGLAPFISEFLVLVGTFTRYPVVAVVATVALVLSAVYVLWAYQRMMTGPIHEGTATMSDLRPREVAVLAPLIVLLVLLGVYPKPALDMIDPAVGHTMSVIGQSDPVPTLRTEASR